MKNNNLKDFVEGLKKIENPIKVNSEIKKIKSILNSNQKTIKDNYELEIIELKNYGYIYFHDCILFQE